MKKLLLAFLLLGSNWIGQAQDKKPSKEETIQFIRNYIISFNKNEPKLVSDYKAGGYTVYNSPTYSNFEIDGCILSFVMTINVETVSVNPDKRQFVDKVEIDLSRCELISPGPTFPNKDGSSPQLSWFSFYTVNHSQSFVKDDEKTDKISIYLEASVDKDSQIYKAFNHLRKLCGAPDPITF